MSREIMSPNGLKEKMDRLESENRALREGQGNETVLAVRKNKLPLSSSKCFLIVTHTLFVAIYGRLESKDGKTSGTIEIS